MIPITKPFADYIGVKYAIAVNSETTALHVAPLAHYTLLESKKAAKDVLSIPVHPPVSRDELDFIINIIKEVELS